MHDYSDSTDRKPADYVLFALGFLGFLIGTAGVIVASKFLAVVGGGLLLLGVISFHWRRDE
jgi:hypothetical protein